MDPISLSMMAVGAGLQLYGGFKQSEHAKEIAQLSQQKAAQEQAINNAKLRQMELEGRRMQMENIRNTQRARAMAVQAGTNQGAQFGTGMLGGIFGVESKGLFNMMGVNAGLSFGREIAGYNNNISNINAQMATVQGNMASDQGYSSLGGALIKAGPITGQIAQGFGNNSANIGTFDNGFGSAPTWRRY